MADVDIIYRGNTIAQMSASGTKTLLTAGKICRGNITVNYTSPGGGGTPTDIMTNGDFSDGTTGWSSINAQATVSVSGGVLTLTHVTTSNRNYGVYGTVATQAGHIYLIKYKLKKTMVDTDADARGIVIGFGDTSTGQAITTIRNVAQNDVLEQVTAIRATANETQIRFNFLGSIATAASNDSMMEIEYVEVYDITDYIP